MLEILLRDGCSGRSTLVVALGAAFLLCGQASPAHAASDAPSLALPVDCVPGETCWIAKFVDLDPGPGVRDYACEGRANDAHSGVDIALRDLRAMDAGVAVVAAAAGTVLRTRDGVPDLNVRETGPEKVKMGECGNGVIVDHGNKWQTQYCHMRQGSIAVKPGQKIAAGEKLGLVGMSGSSEFPHLHFSVTHAGKTMDPFVGTDGRADGTDCGVGKAPLWNAAALDALAYTPAAIYNAGFSAAPPSDDEMRSGSLRALEIDPAAPAFILWTEIFGVEAGDSLHMRLTGPGGEVLVESTTPLETRLARRFQFIGKKRRAAAWPAGDYRGDITLTREVNGVVQVVSRTVEGRVAGVAPAAGPVVPTQPEIPARREITPPAWIPSDEIFIPAFIGTIAGFLVLIAAFIGVRMWRRR